MSIDANFSVFISFSIFAYIFAKKVYPLIINYLDDYINSVKLKIQQSENLKKDAYTNLKNAFSNRNSIKKVIIEKQKKSDERIANLQKENEIYLKALKVRHDSAFKTQLATEVAKQKNILIKELSDTIINEVKRKIISGESKFEINIDKTNLYKLLGDERKVNANSDFIA